MTRFSAGILLLCAVMLGLRACGTWSPTEKNSDSLSTDSSLLSFSDPTLRPNQDIPHAHAHISTVSRPTCTEPGYTLLSCKCGNTRKENLQNALGHTFGEWEIILQPTYKTEGKRIRTCEVCGEEETQAVEKLYRHVHHYTKTHVNPTCTQQGYDRFACSCGDYYTEGSLAPIGHTFGTWQTVVEPSETFGGLERRRCASCGGTELKTLYSDTSFPSTTTGTITYYSQTDSRWGEKWLGCGIMKNNGCGPAAMAMALSYYGVQVTPYQVALWLYESTEEFNRSFHGVSGTGIKLGLEHWRNVVVPIASYEEFKAHLQAGAVVVGCQGKGIFVNRAESSHCIAMLGWTDDGKVRCYDSLSPFLNGYHSGEAIWEQRSRLAVDLRWEGITHYAMY